MSDKSKRMRDDARIRATTKLGAPEPLRCQCGRTVYETTVWEVQVERGRSILICEKCGPDEFGAGEVEMK